MAKLSDKQKAAAIVGDAVEPEEADEPITEPTEPDEIEEEPESEEAEAEEEKPTTEKVEPDSSFTKQFPNLKGETPEEYIAELEKAYDNSFKEALRMNQAIKDSQVASPVQPETPPTVSPPAPPMPAAPVYSAIDEHPAIQYAKAKQTEDMLNAFDDFKKQFPQATEQQDFDRFTKASDGVNKALTDSLGRAPTYKELFPAIAGSLGWQPSSSAKDAAIKDNASSSRTTGAQSPARPRVAKVSDKQVDAYLKLSGKSYGNDGVLTSKTREDAIKELSEVV